MQNRGQAPSCGCMAVWGRAHASGPARVHACTRWVGLLATTERCASRGGRSRGPSLCMHKPAPPPLQTQAQAKYLPPMAFDCEPSKEDPSANADEDDEVEGDLDFDLEGAPLVSLSPCVARGGPTEPSCCVCWLFGFASLKGPSRGRHQPLATSRWDAHQGTTSTNAPRNAEKKTQAATSATSTMTTRRRPAKTSRTATPAARAARCAAGARARSCRARPCAWAR